MPPRGRVREPEHGVEHVVGRGGREPDRARAAEGAVARDPQLADERLLVLGVPRRDDDRARPAHLEHERVVGGERPGCRHEVGGHPHDLVGVHVGRARRVVADPDLREADVVAQRVVDGVARVGVDDRDLEPVERALRERDRLPGGGARRVVEVDGDRDRHRRT